MENLLDPSSVDLCSVGGATLSLGRDFTPREVLTEVNIPHVEMVNPRIPAAINACLASDNYFLYRRL